MQRINYVQNITQHREQCTFPLLQVLYGVLHGPKQIHIAATLIRLLIYVYNIAIDYWEGENILPQQSKYFTCCPLKLELS